MKITDWKVYDFHVDVVENGPGNREVIRQPLSVMSPDELAARRECVELCNSMGFRPKKIVLVNAYVP